MPFELNEDQIFMIEAKLNFLHSDWERCRWEDPEGYEYITGCSDGIVMMLEYLGYETVWNEDLERFQIRRKSNGRQ